MGAPGTMPSSRRFGKNVTLPLLNGTTTEVVTTEPVDAPYLPRTGGANYVLSKFYRTFVYSGLLKERMERNQAKTLFWGLNKSCDIVSTDVMLPLLRNENFSFKDFAGLLARKLQVPENRKPPRDK
jgi:hypothetical protein